jgi:hypothetical protein
MATVSRADYGQVMTKKNFLPADRIGFLAGMSLLAVLTGCMVEGSSRRGGYRSGPVAQVQTSVVVQDDYDYYPGYETYYSRNRHEYVYREGNAWVRRPEPQGVAVNVLLAAPSVRLDFHDSPEQHHSNVVQSYPKSWKRPDNNRDDKNDRPDNKKKGPKDDRRDNDKNDHDKRD